LRLTSLLISSKPTFHVRGGHGRFYLESRVKGKQPPSLRKHETLIWQDAERRCPFLYVLKGTWWNVQRYIVEISWAPE